MTYALRRRALVVVAGVTLVLALTGVAGAVIADVPWVLSGAALSVAVGAFAQAARIGVDGRVTPRSARDRVLVFFGGVVALTLLVSGGITDGSLLNWIIVAFLAVGLIMQIVGHSAQTRSS